MIVQIPRDVIREMKKRESEGMAAVQRLFAEAFETWKDDPVRLAELCAELLWLALLSYDSNNRVFGKEYMAMHTTVQHYASDHCDPVQYERYTNRFRVYWETECSSYEYLSGSQTGLRPS